MTDNLTPLIERVEAASGRDQFAILMDAWQAVHGTKAEARGMKLPEFQRWRDALAPFERLMEAGAFLDAAMTLVPNDPCIGWEVSDGAGGPTARIWHVGIDRADDWEIGASPLATPALALVAASLRALQHQETGHG